MTRIIILLNANVIATVGVDNNPTSEGTNGIPGPRNSPTVFNAGFHFVQFWDGRAASLEEQALGPIENPIEMGHTLDGMLGNLQGIDGYKKYFNEAFGSEEITAERVAKALADYERTRMSGNSPWDRWKYGRDESGVYPYPGASLPAGGRLLPA